MKINFLGTGSAFAHKQKNNSALLEFNNTNLLLDCGYTVPASFESIYYDLSKLHNVFITHLHGDHINGLEELGFKTYFFEMNKPNIYIHKSLLDDLKAYLRITMNRTGLNVEDIFEFIPVDNHFFINNFKFSLIKVKHVPGKNCFGLFTNKFIYTGDSKLLDVYINIPTFHDCQLQDFGDNVHATLDELLNLSYSVRQNIRIMHYGDDIEKYRNQIESHGIKICEFNKPIEL